MCCILMCCIYVWIGSWNILHRRNDPIILKMIILCNLAVMLCSAAGFSVTQMWFCVTASLQVFFLRWTVLLCSFSDQKRLFLLWETLPQTERGNITTASLNAKISFMSKNKNYMNINILLYDYTSDAYLSWFIHMHFLLLFFFILIKYIKCIWRLPFILSIREMYKLTNSLLFGHFWLFFFLTFFYFNLKHLLCEQKNYCANIF